MTAFIILPNQLFDIKLDGGFKYYLIEHPVFFTMHPYNKAKLVMHRYTMKKYAKTRNVYYMEFDEKYQDIFKKYKKIITYDPVDHFIADDFNTLAKSHHCEIQYLPNPGWLEGSLEYTGGRIQTNFYRWQRLRLGLFTNRMNPLTYDSENREKFDSLTGVDNHVYKEHTGLEYKKAVAYVNKHFGANPGEAVYWLPADHNEAVKYLHDFFKYRLQYFGKYEDAIHPDALFGYHSVISPILNIGLLTPDFVIAEVQKIYRKYPFSSIEGFIRQIIGWREFCRLVYVQDGPMYGNRFGANRLMPRYWYFPDKTTADVPEIVHRLLLKVWKTGYLHHIERLMVICNYMNYVEIRPDYCYRWFMSAFLDSYHVFMETNLYGMGMDVIDKTKKYRSPYRLPKNWQIWNIKPYQTKQYMTNRMYICSSNYIRKMGWPLSAGDIRIFDELYHRFVRKHKKYLQSNYANARNIRD